MLEKGRGSHVGQKNFEKAERESPENVCYTSLYGRETVALTEQQQQLQVCENNWVRRITRTKRVDRRRMNDLRKEVGMQCSLTGKLVRRRMRWAGKNYCKQTSQESRGEKISRTQEKGNATCEMGGLREEGHEKIGGG